MTRILALAALLSAVGVPGTALAQTVAAPPPPGPPPGNGGDLPAPPGTAPTVVPPGTAAAIPSGATGPGLLSNTEVALNRAKRSFLLRFACQAKGTVSVTVRSVSRARVARTSYRCSANRATARFAVSSRTARRLARRKVATATATVKQAGKTARLSFTLRAGGGAAPPKGFWTDGHLQCTDSAGAPNAYLVEPDFTTATPTPISTRGWVAWYSPAGGWHWLGVRGENANRWDTWTAGVTGIAQFHPGGQPTPVPWTWGPISVPPGQGIHAVGVYEIVYWVGGRPDYQWQYVNAGTTGAAAAGGGNLYCAY
ncbi:MAG TPA: hypothetical protein VKB54_19860 [Solirubrobacteraceae bacterium]|nr:hypothetical protein [Solirubrobacteraceae bacterium]